MNKRLFALCDLALKMREDNYEEYSELTLIIVDLLNTLSYTANCPSNWRTIGEELLEKYKDTPLYEDITLFEYEQ